MSDLALVDTQDGVRTIAMNRPEALNAFTPDLLDALIAAFTDAASDPGVRVVVVSGAGRAFSAGVDLKVLQSASPVAGRLAGVYEGRDEATIAALRAIPVPVIAKVHGACFTGALEMALHCDLLYTVQSAKFGDTHAAFAIRPTWGMSQNLPLAVGLRRAKELAYTARMFSGAEAERYGLALEAAPDAAALDALVTERAGAIAAADRETVIAYKALHRMHEDRLIGDALAAEVEADFPAITATAARLARFKSS